MLLFALTLVFALPLGLLVAFGRMSRHWFIQWPIRFYLLVMRGTPLMLQLIFFYFGPWDIARFPAAVLTFSLNYAAYFAEIYRGGIEGIPVGQWEAAQVLGLTKVQTFFRIVLPQVVKNILPPMGNEFMVLVKDTALAQVIGVSELFRLAFSITSREFTIMPIFICRGVLPDHERLGIQGLQHSGKAVQLLSLTGGPVHADFICIPTE